MPRQADAASMNVDVFGGATRVEHAKRGVIVRVVMEAIPDRCRAQKDTESVAISDVPIKPDIQSTGVNIWNVCRSEGHFRALLRRDGSQISEITGQKDHLPRLFAAVVERVRREWLTRVSHSRIAADYLHSLFAAAPYFNFEGNNIPLSNSPIRDEGYAKGIGTSSLGLNEGPHGNSGDNREEKGEKGYFVPSKESVGDTAQCTPSDFASTNEQSFQEIKDWRYQREKRGYAMLIAALISGFMGMAAVSHLKQNPWLGVVALAGYLGMLVGIFFGLSELTFL